MKYALLLTTAIAMGAVLFNNVNRAQSVVPAEVRSQFQQWKMDNAKFYSATEDNYRLSVFNQNIVKINAVNAAQSDYTLAINKFADLTKEEFLAKYTGGPMRQASEETEFTLSTVGLPAKVDWRTKGAVTPVKNQGQCGSCWAFSTTGSLEGLNVISGNPLTSFSEQQIMDCSTSYGNQGCNGGLMKQAMKYVKATGIETEAQYPYTMQDGTCHSNPADYVFHISGYTAVPSYNNDALQAGVAQQPVSIAVDANALQFYSGGIITSDCGQSLDHGVLAVGYNTSSGGTKYWIVKNSWGAGWGMSGYFEVLRITGQGPSPCGVSEQASFPTGGSTM